MPSNRNTCLDCNAEISHDAKRCKSCAMRLRHAESRSDLVPPNPSGKCFCGCGGITPIADATRRRKGYVKGEHVRWIQGHQTRKPRPDTGGAQYTVEDRGYETSCWIWQGGINQDGYAMISRLDGKRQVRAHRVLYEKHVGPIPDGAVLDHLCRVRCCVNPAHLEPVTVGENINRGVWPNGRGFAYKHRPSSRQTRTSR